MKYSLTHTHFHAFFTGQFSVTNDSTTGWRAMKEEGKFWPMVPEFQGYKVSHGYGLFASRFQKWYKASKGKKQAVCIRRCVFKKNSLFPIKYSNMGTLL